MQSNLINQFWIILNPDYEITIHRCAELDGWSSKKIILIKRNETKRNETKRNETANETDVLARKVDLQGVEETGKYIFDPLRARDKKRFV